MQPLKLVIPGKFWDCQIYRGKLYLFERSGAIRVINWDRFIEQLLVPSELQLAATCAFAQGDYLYGAQWDLLFRDSDIKNVLLSKFEKLAGFDLEIPKELIKQSTMFRHDSPFPFPHIDSTIYVNKMYVAAQNGVYSATVGPRLVHGVSTFPTKIWDCPVISVTGSYDSLALAAGAEGLYEHPLHDYFARATEGPTQLAKTHCSRCAWVYYSVFGSSLVSGGVLASFEKTGPKGDSDRVFKGTRSAKAIFHQEGYAWGAQDKLYQYHDEARVLSVRRYSPWADSEKKIEDLGSIEFLPSKGQFVGARVAMFGTVMEFEGALVVLTSDGGVVNVWGEPVAWRVYPRSRRYENHLHVVFDDRFEIHSFNHDYFIDQESKKSGIKRFGAPTKVGG
jgi:hypothetical protein